MKLNHKMGFLRLSQIIVNYKTFPPILPIIPVSKSTWWAAVKSGRFPKPLKLGTRITVWRVEDIQALLKQTETTQIKKI